MIKNTLNRIIGTVLRREYSRVEHFRSRATSCQWDIFSRLIERGENTAFGTDHRFSSISSYEDFCKRVPVRTYESLFPYIERCLYGEKNVLWDKPLRHFSKSSGTTNAQSKYIPISSESLSQCHIRAARDLVSSYLTLHPDSRMFTGKALRLGGSLRANDFGTGIKTGDLSAILMSNTPRWADMYSTPCLKTSIIEDWNEKLPRMVEEVRRADVTSLAGVPSWMLVMLNTVMEACGADDITQVWPHLELFMHGGISFSPYREIYKRIIPSHKMHYYEVYNASEGFFAFQDTIGGGDMLLMSDHGVFYEFIPMSVFGTEREYTLPLEGVECGINYAMVITTNGGLWRYLIGDTVRFTSVNPYRIVITGRTKQYINAFGEELMVENADKALLKASQVCKCDIAEYTAAPVFMEQSSNGAHQWIIEFNTPASDMKLFIDTFDATLMELNSDYRAKRYSDVTLRRPLVNVVPRGTFYNWMESRGKLGGQNKVPRLSGDRTYVESILALVEDNVESY